jgi:hypothetical protein
MRGARTCLSNDDSLLFMEDRIMTLSLRTMRLTFILAAAALAVPLLASPAAADPGHRGWRAGADVRCHAPRSPWIRRAYDRGYHAGRAAGASAGWRDGVSGRAYCDAYRLHGRGPRYAEGYHVAYTASYRDAFHRGRATHAYRPAPPRTRRAAWHHRRGHARPRRW